MEVSFCKFSHIAIGTIGQCLLIRNYYLYNSKLTNVDALQQRQQVNCLILVKKKQMLLVLLPAMLLTVPFLQSTRVNDYHGKTYLVPQVKSMVATTENVLRLRFLKFVSRFYDVKLLFERNWHCRYLVPVRKSVPNLCTILTNL